MGLHSHLVGIEVITELVKEQLREEYVLQAPDREYVQQLKMLVRLCTHLAAESNVVRLGHPTVVTLPGPVSPGLYSEIRLFDDMESDDPSVWQELTEDGEPLRAMEGDILISFR